MGISHLSDSHNRYGGPLCPFIIPWLAFTMTASFQNFSVEWQSIDIPDKALDCDWPSEAIECQMRFNQCAGDPEPSERNWK